ncbi:SDR family oxidoreductase [Steroidobacter denitrificans]|uniref:SDR family oxidoreductase n=1 Tax=Steroidobacter denitrificans TaxID=465721 RepID=UPI00143B7A59|nr:NmrA family NAD(P)-binding protein [Steroidobacter denitrificans]
MNIKNVIIFGAAGQQGRPQVREALRQGYRIRAVSRRLDAFNDPEYKDVQTLSADYDVPASLEAALEGMDAVLVQLPSGGNLEHTLGQCANLSSAIKKSTVRLIVYNTSNWGPDTPCGVPIYDYVLKFEETFRATGVPLVIFRPGIFMDNLATPFMKPMFVNEGVYRYPHTLDAAYDWICHEDLAKFMIAALQRPDLAGRKIHLGGRERLTTAQVIAILSEAIGRPIRYEYITSRKLGEDLYDLTVAGQGTGGVLAGVTRDEYAADLEAFYDFVDHSPLKPFQADMKKVLALIPIQMTDMRTWAGRQDWSRT